MLKYAQRFPIKTHLPRQNETTARMLNNVSTSSSGCSVTRPHHLICGNTTEWQNSIRHHTWNKMARQHWWHNYSKQYHYGYRNRTHKKLKVQSKKRQLETSRQDRRQYATLRSAQGNTSNLCLPCISLLKWTDMKNNCVTRFKNIKHLCTMK